MKRYTAINIGPIIAAFGLARKPRELWAASFMFSYLMEKIIMHINNRYKELTLVSPVIVDRAISMVGLENGVGLYPDRAFYAGDVDICELSKDLTTISKVVAKKLLKSNDEKKYSNLANYFNIMITAVEARCESEAISKLNKQLDVVELCDTNRCDVAEFEVLELITKRRASELFKIANSADRNNFDVYSLCQYAAIELAKDFMKERGNDDFENVFYGRFSDNKQFKSRHKYICIVQADGDNVGKIVSHKDLKDGELPKISKALLEFGSKACKKIEDYGGLPIYAGGDDLLFIAPVVGKTTQNIFELINGIDECFAPVADTINEYGLSFDNESIRASMSYGVSITYYNFPLYEAWEAARNLLFGVAKSVTKKDAIAWKLQKHSGSTFEGTIHKGKQNNEINKLYSSFIELLRVDQQEKEVSVVAHKLRELEDILKMLQRNNTYNRISRVDALFDNILDSNINTNYITSVKDLLVELLNCEKAEELTKTIYGMVRTAKFIKGEELKDE